jgi:hypothetical protein
MRDNTTGNNLTAVGWRSLLQNTTGIENTAVGLNSLYSNTTGSYNVAVGQQALNGSTTANYNTAVGYQAGYATTTSYNNVFIGSYAGAAVTTSQENTYVGVQAGQVATGYYNTFVGKSSGVSMTTGYANTIIGKYSGNAGGLDIRTANNYIVLSDGDGNPRATYNATGVYMFVQGAPTSKSTTATLTGAEVLTQILNTTGSSYTVTLPTGTNLDTATGGMPTDTAFDFTVINTASGTITIAVNTGITNLGTLTVATNVSATFRLRKTAANTFIIYRV